MYGKQKSRLAEIVTLCCVLLMGSRSWSEVKGQPDVATEIHQLANVAEFKGPERARLLKLPASAVTLLIENVERAPTIDSETSFLSLLAIKVGQAGLDLPPQQRQAAVDLLVAKCEKAGGNVQRHRLSMLTQIGDPKVDRLVARLASSVDSETREAARMAAKKRAAQQH